jgi:glycosyltransferase involved in cell wall biosynthesis
MTRVVSFGVYSTRPEYPRQRNLVEGLRSHGVEVLECHHAADSSFKARFRSASNLLAAVGFGLRLVRSFLALSTRFKRLGVADAILVGYPGLFHVHLAQWLGRRMDPRPRVVVDVFAPVYETVVTDRRLLNEGSVPARLLRWFEARAYRAADVCLIDTPAHGDYLAELFDLHRDRVVSVPVGPLFPAFSAPSSANDAPDALTVLFVGTFIPLQGVDTILRAARQLANEPRIRFLLVGSGQTRAEAEAQAREWHLDNVEFRDWVSADELPALIRSCDVSLGIFGTTDKADRVVPHKVFDACAAGVALITADSVAARRVLTDRESALLVAAGNSGALAEAILKLRDDPSLRRRLAEGALRLAQRDFAPAPIGSALLEAVLGFGPSAA